MNITQETDGLESLRKAMEQKDKEVVVNPACSWHDEECLSCGS